MMRTTILATGLVLCVTAATAQEGEWPADWKVRFDRAGHSKADIEFVTMAPGWHVTTGPAAILYDPGRTAEGAYRVRSTIFLFDPGERHAEAYGVFFGGRNLDDEHQRYSYFLIRDTGHFLVKNRTGDDTETVVDWTASDAIMKHPGGGEQAENTLTVECGLDEIEFYINDTKVTSVPRSDLYVDGVVGLRINHRLNLHVSELELEPMAESG